MKDLIVASRQFLDLELGPLPRACSRWFKKSTCASTGIAPAKPLAQCPSAIKNRRDIRRAVVRCFADAHLQM